MSPKKKAKSSQPITKDMNLAEVIFKWPATAEVFIAHGLHCVGCAAAGFDTIERGAKVHGLSDEEIAEMVARASEVVLHDE